MEMEHSPLESESFLYDLLQPASQLVPVICGEHSLELRLIGKENGHGEALPKALRLYDVSFAHFTGDNYNRYWEFGTRDQAEQWLLCGLSPGASYIVHYGWITGRGSFEMHAQTPLVTVPLAAGGSVRSGGRRGIHLEEL